MSNFWNIYCNGITWGARSFGALLILVGVKEVWGPGSDLIAAGVLLVILSKPGSITLHHRDADAQPPQPNAYDTERRVSHC
jgi:hypothetical protein